MFNSMVSILSFHKCNFTRTERSFEATKATSTSCGEISLACCFESEHEVNTESNDLFIDDTTQPHPVFYFKATYEVKAGKKKRDHESSIVDVSVGLLTRKVRILDLAVLFLLAYVKRDDAKTTIPRSQFLLHLIYLFACAFSKIVDKALQTVGSRMNILTLAQTCKTLRASIPNAQARSKHISDTEISVGEETNHSLQEADDAERDEIEGIERDTGIESDDDDEGVLSW